MKTFLFCLLLCGAVYAEDNERVTAVFNDYVDTALPHIVEFVVENNLDPMALPDIMASFSAKPLLITYHGVLELTEGILNNIKSLHRADDVVVHYSNKQIHVTGSFGIKDIDFFFKYKAKIWNLGPSGNLNGYLSSASIYFDVIIDLQDFEIILNEFYIHDVGTIQVKLSGNALIDWLANAIVRVVIAIFKDNLLTLVEGKLRNEIHKLLNTVNENFDLTKSFLDTKLVEASHIHYGDEKKEMVKNALQMTDFYMKQYPLFVSLLFNQHFVL